MEGGPVIVTRSVTSTRPTSSLNPPGQRDYAKDNHTLTLGFIILYIITFFIYVILEIFFVFRPIRRMEQKFDQTTAKIDIVAADAKVAAEGVDKLVSDIEDLGKIALAEFDKVKAGVCRILHGLNIDLPFCSESRVAAITNTSTSTGGSGFGSGDPRVQGSRASQSSCRM